MINTKKHNFYIPEASDDILDSVDKYGKNFKRIDELIDKEAPTLDLALNVGDIYPSGEKVYNNTPVIGDYVGWVNIRTGTYARKWSSNHTYNAGDLVVSNNGNGFYYICLVNGVSSPIEPTFPTVVGASVDDTFGILSWTPSTYYSVGKIVKRTSGDTSFYYKCVIAGTSGAIEPLWLNVSGTTVVDGSVTWMMYKKAVWKNAGVSCDFRPFGKID